MGLGWGWVWVGVGFGVRVRVCFFERVWGGLVGEFEWWMLEMSLSLVWASFLGDFGALVSERLKVLRGSTRGLWVWVMMEITEGLEVAIEFRLGSKMW
jgi:hypothetical protein